LRALLEKTTEEEIWRKHLALLDKKFVEAFSSRESMLKMLDECNWAMFTVKRIARIVQQAR